MSAGVAARLLRIAQYGAPRRRPRRGTPPSPRRLARSASPRCAIASARSASSATSCQHVELHLGAVAQRRPPWRRSRACRSAPVPVGKRQRRARSPANASASREASVSSSSEALGAARADGARPRRAPRRTSSRAAVSPATISHQRGAPAPRAAAADPPPGAIAGRASRPSFGARRCSGRHPAHRMRPRIAGGSDPCGKSNGAIQRPRGSSLPTATVSSSQACIAGLPAHEPGVLDARRRGPAKSVTTPPASRTSSDARRDVPGRQPLLPEAVEPARRDVAPGRARRTRAAGCRWSAPRRGANWA